jgi:hypothetical protein
MELRYLNMLWASTAHHQEVRFMYVENGTSKMAVSNNNDDDDDDDNNNKLQMSRHPVAVAI